MTREQRIEAELRKVADWVERLLAYSESRAKDRQFPSLSEAHEADARNYRATLKSIRAALSTGEPTKCQHRNQIGARDAEKFSERCLDCGELIKTGRVARTMKVRP